MSTSLFTFGRLISMLHICYCLWVLHLGVHSPYAGSTLPVQNASVGAEYATLICDLFVCVTFLSPSVLNNKGGGGGLGTSSGYY